MSDRYSICDTAVCPNQGLVANHPRSATPKECGMCEKPVRLIFAQKKFEEAEI